MARRGKDNGVCVIVYDSSVRLMWDVSKTRVVAVVKQAADFE
jgi:hypothetical protein